MSKSDCYIDFNECAYSLASWGFAKFYITICSNNFCEVFNNFSQKKCSTFLIVEGKVFLYYEGRTILDSEYHYFCTLIFNKFNC